MANEFIDRLHAELEQVGERYQSLGNFFQTHTFHMLTEEHKGMLSTQFGIMSAYIDILKLRILVLTKEYEATIN